MLFDPNYVSNLAASLDQSSSVEEKLTTELSSGLSVVSLQDNPVASSAKHPPCQLDRSGRYLRSKRFWRRIHDAGRRLDIG